MLQHVSEGSDDYTIDDGRDLEQTVYWGDKGMNRVGDQHATTHNTGQQHETPPQTPSQQRNPSPTSSQRRVSFAEDVWVTEIPRVDESDLPTLFYSEADIDDMYQEAEGKGNIISFLLLPYISIFLNSCYFFVLHYR